MIVEKNPPFKDGMLPIHPGVYIAEDLEEWGMSPAELGRRFGRAGRDYRCTGGGTGQHDPGAGTAAVALYVHLSGVLGEHPRAV